MDTKAIVKVGAGGMGIMAILQLALGFFTGGKFPDLSGILSAVVPLLTALGIHLVPNGGSGSTMDTLQAIATLINSGMFGEAKSFLDSFKTRGFPTALEVEAQWKDGTISKIDYGTITKPTK